MLLTTPSWLMEKSKENEKKIHKLMKTKIPEEWCEPDSFFFNFVGLIVWIIIASITLFLMMKFG